MKKRYWLILFLIMCIMFIPNVLAKEIDHLYTSSSEDLVFDDTVNGSSALAGFSVKSNGRVKGINFLAGNNVFHTGQSDYLALAGNSVSVSGIVVNDALIAGNVVEIKSDADLRRDVIIFGSDVTIKGNLNRNLTVYCGRALISDANIGGNVKIYAEDIKVDDNVLIDGTLSYLESANASINSSIGNVIKIKDLSSESTEDFMNDFTHTIWSFMSVIFIFALLTLLLPKIFDRIDKDYEVFNFSKGVELFTKGLVFLIVTPMISIFLFILPFGLPLAFIILALYFIIIYLSKLFAGYLLGYKIWQKFIKCDTNVLLVGFIGFVILFILDLIPGINILVSIFSLLIGIGIIYNLLLCIKNY